MAAALRTASVDARSEVGESAQPEAMRPLFVAGAATASFAWFAALDYGARMLAPLFARPAAWRVLDAIVGAAMLAMAATPIACATA